nr:hypothetical protein [uncultured Lachnoclostridium sp.]
MVLQETMGRSQIVVPQKIQILQKNVRTRERYQISAVWGRKVV